MTTLLDYLYSKRQEAGKFPESPLPALSALKAAYTELLQKEKTLETYLDDNSVPVELREAKIEEFKAILSQLNQLLIDIVQSGHFLKREEVLEGF